MLGLSMNFTLDVYRDLMNSMQCKAAWTKEKFATPIPVKLGDTATIYLNEK